MSRYCGPRLRIIRRLGELPGLTSKSPKILAPPGQHGAVKKKNKLSQYGARLKEKQRLRYNYGISERKLLIYVKTATKAKESTGDVLLQLLEMRLDNVLFRLGFAPSIASARQAINHRHVSVNNRPITIASYACKPTDQISISSKKYKSKASTEKQQNITPPHLLVEAEPLTGTVKSMVDRQHVGVALNERLIVEFYSRKV